MKQMKSQSGLHMKLEHLASECLFLGTVHKLLVYNFTSVFMLKMPQSDFPSQKSGNFKYRKSFRFCHYAVFGRSFETTNCSISTKFGAFMVFGV